MAIHRERGGRVQGKESRNCESRPVSDRRYRDFPAVRRCEVVGFRGAIRFDPSRPDGTPRKLLDVSRLSALGWSPRVSLREGLERTYRWFVEHELEVRGAQPGQ